jgi:hypothetical protein
VSGAGVVDDRVEIERGPDRACRGPDPTGVVGVEKAELALKSSIAHALITGCCSASVGFALPTRRSPSYTAGIPSARSAVGLRRPRERRKVTPAGVAQDKIGIVLACIACNLLMVAVASMLLSAPGIAAA